MSGEDRGVGASLLRGVLRARRAVLRRRHAWRETRSTTAACSRRTSCRGRPSASGTSRPAARAKRRSSAGWRSSSSRATCVPRFSCAATAPRRPAAATSSRCCRITWANGAIVIANPDRVAGAAEAMRRAPQPDVFMLDDGFQHRRVKRDFDLLLINAAEPFGYGHVLPRGLLREAASGGMRRADAILITHDDPAISARDDRRDRAGLPRRSTRRHTSLRRARRARPADRRAAREKFFAFAGIANPAAFRAPARRATATPSPASAPSPIITRTREADLAALRNEAARRRGDDGDDRKRLGENRPPAVGPQRPADRARRASTSASRPAMNSACWT